MTSITDYSLWRTTKKLKRPIARHPPMRKPNNTWAKSDHDKAKVFANHLEEVLTPNPDLGSYKTQEVHEIL